MLNEAQAKVNLCIKECNSNDACENTCNKPLLELRDLANKKEDIYVRKGVEYCKSECWESKDLTECSERCTKDYSSLYPEFKKSLVAHFNTTKFYNN